MNQKFAAIIVATMLVAITGAVLLENASESDGSVTTTGSVQVSYYTGTENGWSSVTVSAYDVYQAVNAAQTSLGYTVTVTENTWNQYNPYGYWEPNENYGTVTAVNGFSSFNIYVYNNTSNSWVAAQAALGWYRPFTDYATTVSFVGGASAGASNVAITTAVSAPASDDVTPIGLTSIVSNGNYRYAFTLKDNTQSVNVPSGTYVTTKNILGYNTETLTSEMLQGGITIYGYGSDAYLALKNALSSSDSNIVGGNTTFVLNNPGTIYEYYTYYSWMGSILGSGTVPVTGTDEDDRTYTQYKYWVQDSVDTDLNGGDYTLGYYSILNGAYNDVSEFTLTYDLWGQKYYD